MLDTVPAYLHANLSFFSILLCGVAAAFMSYFLYRRTVPPLPVPMLVSLAVIRGVVVALILLLLFSPEITLNWQKKIPVKIGIAVDRSASMGLDNKIEEADSNCSSKNGL